jgi:sulfite exporter TauE/SafE
VNLPALLAIAAGAFLIYQGLASLNLLPRRIVMGHSSCLAGSMFKTYLTGQGFTQIFLAGMLTGFLPCGLLYGMLTLAASTRHVGYGDLLMACFGLGTAPVMMLFGSGGSLFSLASRKHVYQVAA